MAIIFWTSLADESFHQRKPLQVVKYLSLHVTQQLLMIRSDFGQEEIRLELNTGNRSDAKCLRWEVRRLTKFVVVGTYFKAVVCGDNVRWKEKGEW